MLRYDLIDRPGVPENYVPVNYHCLYDLSVLVVSIRCILRAGNGAPLNINAIQSKSIKTYLNQSRFLFDHISCYEIINR